MVCIIGYTLQCMVMAKATSGLVLGPDLTGKYGHGKKEQEGRSGQLLIAELWALILHFVKLQIACIMSSVC